jgi:multidrug efflux pump subunit AcrB
MVIGAQWPGASPEEMTRQVTDRIEKKLEERGTTRKPITGGQSR